jgi:hypothetical protein
VRIDYKTHNISPSLQQNSDDSSTEGLEAHGLLGMHAIDPKLFLCLIGPQAS